MVVVTEVEVKEGLVLFVDLKEWFRKISRDPEFDFESNDCLSEDVIPFSL